MADVGWDRQFVSERMRRKIGRNESTLGPTERERLNRVRKDSPGGYRAVVGRRLDSARKRDYSHTTPYAIRVRIPHVPVRRVRPQHGRNPMPTRLRARNPTSTTRAANQQRFRSGTHSAASWPLFSWRFTRGEASVRLRRSRENRALVAESAAQRPESCASLAATMCSMSVSVVDAKHLPVYGPYTAPSSCTTVRPRHVSAEARTLARYRRR